MLSPSLSLSLSFQNRLMTFCLGRFILSKKSQPDRYFQDEVFLFSYKFLTIILLLVVYMFQPLHSPAFFKYLLSSKQHPGNFKLNYLMPLRYLASVLFCFVILKFLHHKLNSQPLSRTHSIISLHKFPKLILDCFIGCIIAKWMKNVG